MELNARFNGISIIQTDEILSCNYKVTVSYKTAFVWKDGVNVCTIYPWKGMTDDDFIRTFGDEFPMLNEEQIRKIAGFVRTHVVAN